MTATKGGLVPVLSPLGHLTLVPEADAPSLPPEVSRRLQEAFTRGAGHGLWALGAGEEKVAAAAREKKPIPWVRVYQIATYVYFSHRVHTAAGATCVTCHGPVRDRDRITKEVLHNMRSCMACHAATKARNDCMTCHEER